MKQYGSIAVSPGKNGAFYYSNFFQYYNIDAVYNPLQANDIQEVRRILVKNEFDGFNVSMPFKKEIIQILNTSSLNVDLYQSCNTIKNIDRNLQGFNTDINGVKKFISYIFEDEKVIVLGDGAMGRTFVKVLMEHKINHQVFSRSLGNWNDRHQKCDVLINCTSFGTSMDLSPIEYMFVERAVFDLAINGNRLKDLCSSITYFPGLLFYKEVFLEQFFIHTGIIPDPNYFDYITAKNIK